MPRQIRCSLCLTFICFSAPLPLFWYEVQGHFSNNHQQPMFNCSFFVSIICQTEHQLHMIQALIARLISTFDPIVWASLKPLCEASLHTALHRSSVLFGSLLQLREYFTTSVNEPRQPRLVQDRDLGLFSGFVRPNKPLSESAQYPMCVSLVSRLPFLPLSLLPAANQDSNKTSHEGNESKSFSTFLSSWVRSA
jgi:hypothetical protein